jgi:hypothetical protein
LCSSIDGVTGAPFPVWGEAVHGGAEIVEDAGPDVCKTLKNNDLLDGVSSELHPPDSIGSRPEVAAVFGWIVNTLRTTLEGP